MAQSWRQPKRAQSLQFPRKTRERGSVCSRGPGRDVPLRARQRASNARESCNPDRGALARKARWAPHCESRCRAVVPRSAALLARALPACLPLGIVLPPRREVLVALWLAAVLGGHAALRRAMALSSPPPSLRSRLWRLRFVCPSSRCQLRLRAFEALWPPLPFLSSLAPLEEEEERQQRR